MSASIYDKIDHAILSRLQQEGRIANVELAQAVSLSPSSCLRRTKALEADGLIAGYRAELDRVRIGLGITAFISLKVEHHSRETSTKIETALTAIPAVVACYVVSGEADFLVEAVVPSLAWYEQLLLDQILAIDPVTARAQHARTAECSREPAASIPRHDRILCTARPRSEHPQLPRSLGRPDERSSRIGLTRRLDMRSSASRGRPSARPRSPGW